MYDKIMGINSFNGFAYVGLINMFSFSSQEPSDSDTDFTNNILWFFFIIIIFRSKIAFNFS